jgi:hypothetical protein
MPVAPRDRPEKHSVLHTFTVYVRATPDAVFRAVATRVDPAQTASLDMLTDTEGLVIVVQGTWWYRGEYRVVGDSAGSTLEYVVVNVAQRGERAALLAARRSITTAPLAFHELVKSLRAELE